jgi:DNA polymerase sigma
MAGANSANSGLQSFEEVANELNSILVVTKDLVRSMSSCLVELGKLSAELGQEWKVRAFGSVGSGFYTHLSDLDVTCFQDLSSKDSSEQTPPTEALVRYLQVVQQNSSFEVVEEIFRARIPILKLRYNGYLDVDLSFQNRDPFANTQLLRAYATISHSVRQLVLLIKIWAKSECVCGAPDGHLSSYSFTLMVLYYLMVDPQVQMPCFNTAWFKGDRQIPEEAKGQWKCPLGLAALVHRFFEFYVKVYVWGYEVVSVRTGQRLYSDNAVYSQLNVAQGTIMPHIEDPFLLGRNLNCVFGWDQNTMLSSKLHAALAHFEMGMTPYGFYTALTWCKQMLAVRNASEEANRSSKEAGKSDTIAEKSVHQNQGQMPHYMPRALTAAADNDSKQEPKGLPTTALTAAKSSKSKQKNAIGSPTTGIVPTSRWQTEPTKAMGRHAPQHAPQHTPQPEPTKVNVVPRSPQLRIPAPEELPMTSLGQTRTWSL